MFYVCFSPHIPHLRVRDDADNSSTNFQRVDRSGSVRIVRSPPPPSGAPPSPSHVSTTPNPALKPTQRTDIYPLYPTLEFRMKRPPESSGMCHLFSISSSGVTQASGSFFTPNSSLFRQYATMLTQRQSFSLPLAPDLPFSPDLCPSPPLIPPVLPALQTSPKRLPPSPDSSQSSTRLKFPREQPSESTGTCQSSSIGWGGNHLNFRSGFPLKYPSFRRRVTMPTLEQCPSL